MACGGAGGFDGDDFSGYEDISWSGAVTSSPIRGLSNQSSFEETASFHPFGGYTGYSPGVRRRVNPCTPPPRRRNLSNPVRSPSPLPEDGYVEALPFNQSFNVQDRFPNVIYSPRVQQMAEPIHIDLDELARGGGGFQAPAFDQTFSIQNQFPNVNYSSRGQQMAGPVMFDVNAFEFGGGGIGMGGGEAMAEPLDIYHPMEPYFQVLGGGMDQSDNPVVFDVNAYDRGELQPDPAYNQPQWAYNPPNISIIGGMQHIDLNAYTGMRDSPQFDSCPSFSNETMYGPMNYSDHYRMSAMQGVLADRANYLARNPQNSYGADWTADSFDYGPYSGSHSNLYSAESDSACDEFLDAADDFLDNSIHDMSNSLVECSLD